MLLSLSVESLSTNARAANFDVLIPPSEDRISSPNASIRSSTIAEPGTYIFLQTLSKSMRRAPRRSKYAAAEDLPEAILPMRKIEYIDSPHSGTTENRHEKRGPEGPPRRRLASPAPPTGQRRPALPRADPAVPSALGGLASGFGMGPGVPRPPWPLTGGGRSRAPTSGLSRVPWGPHSDDSGPGDDPTGRRHRYVRLASRADAG